MKKIYLFIAGAFLILLIITTLLLSLQKKTTTDAQKSLPFPTSIPNQGSININGNQQANQPNEQNNTTNNSQGGQNLEIQDIQNNATIDTSLIAPVETKDFIVQYNSQLDKLVVVKKTLEAEQKFSEWANQNNYPELVDNPDKVLITNTGEAPHQFNPMLDFFSLFMTFGQGISPSNTNSSIPTPAPPDSNSSEDKDDSPAPRSSSFTYYAQCGDQGSTPLPDGGTLCSAGCGPTTVAMIASSYVNKQYDPRAIVALYDKNNYLLSNGGSRYYKDAYELLRNLGVKTTEIMSFNLERSEKVIPQLKKYLEAGWTFFAYASFCDGGCGHYFWITDIDDKGNIWAYDPAYGKNQIPYNENSRYPYPLYKAAFGVKK